MVRRACVLAVGLYLSLAVVTRFAEAMGAVRCGCASDCWCRRPLTSAFRWVFPWDHRSKIG